MSVSTPLETGTARDSVGRTGPDSPALRVGIAGAGAIGCLLAVLLGRGGARVSVLTRGRSLEQIRCDGIRLHRKGETVQVSVAADDDARRLGVQDVLFLCSKSQDVAALLADAMPMLNQHTRVIPLLNGIPWWFFLGMPGPWSGRKVQSLDPTGNLLNSVPVQQLIGAVVFMTAERTGAAQVTSDNPLLMVLGEVIHGPASDSLKVIATLLEKVGIEVRVTESIRDTLWTKVLANLTSNPLSVISGAKLSDIYGDARLQPIVRKMLQEGMALAATYGARIPFSLPSFMAEGEGMGEVRTSMLQDFLAGRPLELAAIGDAVLELADLQGIDMPVTQRVIALAHFRDDVRTLAPLDSTKG